MTKYLAPLPCPIEEMTIEQYMVWLEECMMVVKRKHGDAGVNLFIERAAKAWRDIIVKGRDNSHEELRARLKEMAALL
jgi:hypothetical protein